MADTRHGGGDFPVPMIASRTGSWAANAVASMGVAYGVVLAAGVMQFGLAGKTPASGAGECTQ